jgi:hypothetical protein
MWAGMVEADAVAAISGVLRCISDGFGTSPFKPAP